MPLKATSHYLSPLAFVSGNDLFLFSGLMLVVVAVATIVVVVVIFIDDHKLN